MNPLVSIILPCYNAEKYLKKCISSLKKQTYKNIEIIAVDDGSTDNTYNILCDERMISNVPISVISKENGGVSSARNSGLSVANGHYIMFIDSDDEYYVDTVEKLVSAVQAEHSDIAFGTWSRSKLEQNNEANNKSLNIDTILKSYIKKDYNLAFYTCIYKKEIISAWNIKFDAELKYGEDNLFYFSYLSHCASGVFFNRAIYIYTDNPNSAVHNISWDNLDALKSAHKAYQYYKDQHSGHSEIILNYWIPRTELMLAKDFARSRKQIEYYRLLNQYPVRSDMRHLIKTDRTDISVAAIVLKFSPGIFYGILSR